MGEDIHPFFILHFSREPTSKRRISMNAEALAEFTIEIGHLDFQCSYEQFGFIFQNNDQETSYGSAIRKHFGLSDLEMLDNVRFFYLLALCFLQKKHTNAPIADIAAFIMKQPQPSMLPNPLCGSVVLKMEQPPVIDGFDFYDPCVRYSYYYSKEDKTLESLVRLRILLQSLEAVSLSSNGKLVLNLAFPNETFDIKPARK